MLRANVKSYVKRCNVFLVLKSVIYNLYYDLQFLLVLTYQWKDFSMDFIIGLPVFTNWKGKTYDLILVIVNRFTKMVYYKLLNITIDVFGLTKVIIDKIMQYNGLLD